MNVHDIEMHEVSGRVHCAVRMCSAGAICGPALGERAQLRRGRALNITLKKQYLMPIKGKTFFFRIIYH